MLEFIRNLFKKKEKNENIVDIISVLDVKMEFVDNSVPELFYNELYKYIDLFFIVLKRYNKNMEIKIEGDSTVKDKDKIVKFYTDSLSLNLDVRPVKENKDIYKSDIYFNIHSSGGKEFYICLYDTYFDSFGITDNKFNRDEVRRNIKKKYGRYNTINYSDGFIIYHEN